MTIPESWGLAKLQEGLDLAHRSVLLLESQAGQPENPDPNVKPRAFRLTEWRDYEHRLRNRLHVVGLTAELDALEWAAASDFALDVLGEMAESGNLAAQMAIDAAR